MKTRSVCLHLFTFAAAVALAAPTTRADIVAFATANGVSYIPSSDYTYGYTFTLANTIRVTQLGVYDAGADGLGTAIPVTIWNSTGIAQATVTLPTGTTTGEINSFFYSTLSTPVTLAAGTYTIGAYFTNQTDNAFYNDTLTGSTGITYGAPRVASGNGDPLSNGAGGTTGYTGPNFQFVVPEPSTWALLGMGAVGLGLTLRKRRLSLAARA